ncbi:hypothetical protein SKAU_G00391430 [Synaphobranchus kaupii]|uniref:Uncharacterized protein n=1 Tax=Synaphobranchus kaupii TaxID=118154 RepID=A0A9Q1EBM9_SYNKA|nr:hypothetical protein SKAU_G00391430 [Synaphobranchus kaupii]
MLYDTVQRETNGSVIHLHNFPKQVPVFDDFSVLQGRNHAEAAAHPSTRQRGFGACCTVFCCRVERVTSTLEQLPGSRGKWGEI